MISTKNVYIQFFFKRILKYSLLVTAPIYLFTLLEFID